MRYIKLEHNDRSNHPFQANPTPPPIAYLAHIKHLNT